MTASLPQSDQWSQQLLLTTFITNAYTQTHKTDNTTKQQNNNKLCLKLMTQNEALTEKFIRKLTWRLVHAYLM